VVSFCNGEFLARLPEICVSGRPACTVWANCMTWNFPDELAAHAAGLIDLFAFQSDYQRSMVAPALEAVRPIRELAGYRPYFSLANAMQGLSFSYRDPAETGYFGLGRVSRDDAHKYPEDMWKIFAQVVSPLPTKTFILGFGENGARKCGSTPPCEWLDWMIWSPGATSPRDLYGRIHVLIHKTGGSRENWPRTVLEAMATGVAVIAEDAWAMPQMIEDGVTGFLCRSSAEMSFRASQLAFDEPLRRHMIHAAHARFLEEHANVERSFAPWQALLAEHG
jgi:glycosyltransferase involved in cell wall biosynthesis